MSTKSRPLSASTAVAVEVAAITGAGSAIAADLNTKAVKAPPADNSSLFIVNDNSISFTWYPTATDPGVSGGGIAGNSNAFNKFVGTATHFRRMGVRH